MICREMMRYEWSVYEKRREESVGGRLKEGGRREKKGRSSNKGEKKSGIRPCRVLRQSGGYEDQRILAMRSFTYEILPKEGVEGSKLTV